jgi:hypothetical protein
MRATNKTSSARLHRLDRPDRPYQPPAMDLPQVWKVREVVVHDGSQYMDPGSFVLIAPAISGHKARYSVIRVDRKTGRATCIGRELDLKLARKVAGRSASEDGLPLV